LKIKKTDKKKKGFGTNTENGFIIKALRPTQGKVKRLVSNHSRTDRNDGQRRQQGENDQPKE